MFDRVTFNPKIMGGRACLRGMRITIAHVVNMVANGMTAKDILEEYPDLQPEDIQQVLQYAAFMTRDETYPLFTVH